jgi:O-antigen/teichoic acid export membrane protein
VSSGVMERLRGRTVLRVGKNTLARLSAQVWAKLLSLVLVALVARYEGTAALGSYVLVLTLVGIATVVSDLGLNIYLTRQAARETDDERQRDLLGLILPLKAGLSTAGMTGLILLGALAPFPDATRRLIPLAALAVVPEGLALTMAALMNARQRMEVSAALNMTVRSVGLAGSLMALVSGLGVAGVLGWSVVASALGLSLSGAVLLRWRLWPRIHLDPRGWRACLTESYPFALTAIISAVYTRVDLILLSMWQGELVAGWYAAAYKLWEAFGLLPASLLEAMFPEMSRLSANSEGVQRLRALFHSSSRAMAIGGFSLAACGAWAAGILIPLVYGGLGDQEPAVSTFRLMLWAIPAMFLYLLAGHTLYALGYQRRVTAAMLLVALTNGLLNLTVIPRWSYSGAAVVALSSEWLLFALLYPWARRAIADAAAPKMAEV